MSGRIPYHTLSLALLIAVAPVLFSGCEGSTRHHDDRVVDITPPEDDYDPDRPRSELPVISDEVEEMMAARQAYIERLIELERAYLESGNTEKANWARRQRELTEKVEVFPYLIEEAPEQSSLATPVDSIPEADAIYDEAYALYDTFVGVPFLGFSKLNHKDARLAVEKFRTILRDYPTSDKVDDAAYYCGVIYKEFLREDDPDNQLALRYYKWALELDPQTPHPVRFDMAVVYDYRLHDRARAIELYHQVLETEEAGIQSNQRWAAGRIEKLSDDDRSPLRPRDRTLARRAPRPSVRRSSSDAYDNPIHEEPGISEPR